MARHDPSVLPTPYVRSGQVGAAPDGAGVRCDLRSALTHLWVRSLSVLGRAFAGTVGRRDPRLRRPAPRYWTLRMVLAWDQCFSRP